MEFGLGIASGALLLLVLRLIWWWIDDNEDVEKEEIAVKPTTGSRELELELRYKNITLKETIERMQVRSLSEENLKFLVKNDLPLRKYVKKRYVNLPLGGAKKIWELDLEKITRDREAVEAYKKSARGAEIIAEGRK